uniref:Uncharacterized protein n=1 Tax=Clastoptera arizonana TaxID=38151 RepID=A0A1B6E3J6_9HEMI
MDNNAVENIIDTDSYKSDMLVIKVANKRKMYPELCAIYCLDILKNEQEQLKNTKFVIPASSSANKINTKYNSTSMSQLFSLKDEEIVKNENLLKKFDYLFEEIKDFEGALSVLDIS